MWRKLLLKLFLCFVVMVLVAASILNAINEDWWGMGIDLLLAAVNLFNLTNIDIQEAD